MLVKFGVLCLAAVALATPLQSENHLLDSVYQDCLQKDTVSCLKYRVFSFADRVLSQSDIEITDGIEIIKSSDTKGAPRALNEATTIEDAMLNKVSSFLDTHTLSINLKGKDIMESAVSTARTISDVFTEEVEIEDEEARGKGGKKKIKKIKKMFGPIFGIVALKAAFLIKLAIVGLALLAGKALIVSKIALLLAAGLGLKKLLGGKLGGGLGGLGGWNSGSGHEIHGSYGGDAGYAGGYASSAHGGGWGRSAEAQKLAYQAYAN